MKRYIMLMCILCVSLSLLFGCSTEDDKPTASLPDEAMTTIVLYAYDALEDDTYSTVYEVAEEDFNLEKVVEAYDTVVVQGVYGKELKINEIKRIDDKVWIDFDSESVNAMGLGSGTEGQLFGDLAHSINSNIETVEEIYYTMDNGKDFETGHLLFTADRPFWYGDTEQLETEAN